MTHKTIFLYSICCAFVLSCSKKTPSITPEVKNITESVYASGFIKSKNQYDISGRTNGIIKKIFATEGTLVKKGDPIFQLENQDLRFVTENARLASSTADYSRNLDKLEDAKKAIDIASKKLANDSLLFQRQKNLWNQNIGSKVDFEQKELNFDNSKVVLAKSKTNYEDLNRQLKLISDQSKNNLEIAKLSEDDFIIRSEVDGVVYKVNREVGELINDADPAAVIGTEEFIIELSVDELDIVKIKKGQTVFIRMDSYKSQVFEAEIIAINPMMNSRTRSFQVDALFTKKPGALFPNLTAEANILIQTKKEVLTIPRNYLLNDSTVVLEGGQPQKIETGLMDYDLVEIRSGIDKDTKIEVPKA